MRITLTLDSGEVFIEIDVNSSTLVSTDDCDDPVDLMGTKRGNITPTLLEIVEQACKEEGTQRVSAWFGEVTA